MVQLRWPFGGFGVMLIGTGTVHQLAGRRPGDERAFRASIAIGIGDDDTVGTLTVSEHGSEARLLVCVVSAADCPGPLAARRPAQRGIGADRSL